MIPGDTQWVILEQNRSAPRGHSGGIPVGKQSDLDNHANQLNPNHDAYWQSRGEDERPADWEEREDEHDKRSRGKAPVRRK